MKKILFYTTFLTSGGGIEVVTEKYLKNLIELGYQVDLYIDYNMGEDNVREKNIDKSIKIKYLKSEKLSKLIYKFRTLGKKKNIYNIPLYLLILMSDYLIWKKEIKIIQKENYDATISFFQFLPSYITKVKGPKHSIFLHGAVHKFFEGFRRFFKENYLHKLDRFDYVCTVSDTMGKELVEMAPYLKEKQRTMYNPINFTEIIEKSKNEAGLTEEEKELLTGNYICSVGRLDENQKDFITLIKAYTELLKKNKIKEKLYIIGDGVDKEKLQELTRNLKIENKVLFLGRKSNPYIWMKNSKLFILSTKFEGFPTVLIEAMILDTPVISSDCPTGPNEMLEKEYLFEIGNKKELEKLIEKVLTRTRKINSKEKALEFQSDIEEIL